MRWTTALALITFLSIPSLAEDSSSYLGRKLEYVLRKVDGSYIEERKEELGQKHRKALTALGEHLARKYPDFEIELTQWLNEHYGEQLREVQSDREEKRVGFDTLLILDRREACFRRDILEHIGNKYPSIFGEIACFLRDNHPSALQEVLRMTLRMTSRLCPFELEDSETPGEPVADPAVRRE